MSRCWREWRRMGAPRLVVQWLRSGVPLRWRGPAPREGVAARGGEDPRVQSELEGLVRAGAFVPLEGALCSPTFLVPKKDGGQRLIHDLRGVNRCLAPPRFSLRGAKEAGEVVRASSWLAAIDLRHGYQQVAMALEARRFLGARLGGRTVAATVLPFGLSLSPYVFTRITNWLARLIRVRTGLRVAVYIDDFLLGAQTEEALRQGLGEVKALFRRLGVVASEDKEVGPATRVPFLGFEWDAGAKTVSVPQTRRAEYRRAVANLLRHPQSRAVWRATIGKLLFLREAVGPALRHTRSLMWASRRRGQLIEAVGEAREDLEWWRRSLSGPLEMSLVLRPVEAALTTDASDTGLGILLDLPQSGEGEGQTAPGGALRQQRTALAAQDPERHINAKELEALLRALELHGDKLRGKRVVWYTDSQTARAAVAHQGSQQLSRETWEAAKAVLDRSQREDIILEARHVPGRLNGAADELSRPGQERSWQEEALAKITREWGPLQEDPCGATREPTTLLEGLGWAGRRTLLWPQPRDLGRTLALLGTAASQVPPQGPAALWPSLAVVVSPTWRGSAWWGDLERLRVSWLPLGRLRSPHLRRWAQRNGHWPDFTASLVPLRTPSGPQPPGRHTSGPSETSSAGRRPTDAS